MNYEALTREERAQCHLDARRMYNLKKQLTAARAQALTQRQQEVMRLYFDENQTMPQIAKLLGINVSTVSRTLMRARSRVQQHLQYGHPPAYKNPEKN